jgi:hypothetical protein
MLLYTKEIIYKEKIQPLEKAFASYACENWFILRIPKNLNNSITTIYPQITKF